LFVTNAIDNLPLPLYGDGRQIRPYQYVMDHIEGLDIVPHKGVVGQVYNVGPNEETANIDMARAILQSGSLTPSWVIIGNNHLTRG
jgi:dTDP-glucose 4,6-dehydratase